ncbi:MAG TPA: transglycosylase SLT domain-containing protein [Candidatus Nitrosotenuis sp.]|nr:transglycosylase SLT domain-containing protein [Candidatus Nitrosotenuis sp.]
MAVEAVQFVDERSIEKKKKKAALGKAATKKRSNLEIIRGNPRFSGGAMLAAVAIGAAVWVGDKGEPETDDCTSVTQQLVQVGAVGPPGKPLEYKNNVRSFIDRVSFGKLINDGRTISGVAHQLSASRGYTIPTERLVAANRDAPYVKFEEGKLLDDMNVESSSSGVFCVNVPSPIYGGYELAQNENDTLANLAKENFTTIETLRALNPHLAGTKDEEIIDSGAVIRISEIIDTSVVYREMTKDESTINNMTNNDIALRQQIVLANIALIGEGQSLSEGNAAYLPFAQTEPLKEHEITTAAVMATFTPESVPLDVTFIEEKKKETAPPEQNVQAAPVPTPLTSDNEAFAEALLALNNSFEKDERWTGWTGDISTLAQIYTDTAARYNHPAVTRERLAAQGFAESKFSKDINSPVGAGGISQIMPGTAEGLVTDVDKNGKASVYDPIDAIDAQARYMIGIYDQYADPHFDGDEAFYMALGGYNAGPGNIQKEGLDLIDGGGNWREPAGYVAKIKEHHDTIKIVQAQVAERLVVEEAARARENEARAECDRLGLSFTGAAEGWRKGEKSTVYLCQIPEKYWAGGKQRDVNITIAEKVMKMMDEMHRRGFKVLLTSDYRTMDEQEQARIRNRCGSPENSSGECEGDPVARPGWSNHQYGEAVDVADENGQLIRERGTPVQRNLKEVAQSLGMDDIASEAWHIELKH